MVMAKILTKCGEFDEAFKRLDDLLSLEGWFTINTLKMDKNFDPIRMMPEYQALLKKYPMVPAS